MGLGHENVKLKLIALTNKVKYRDLMAGPVCDAYNFDCMLHICQKRPGVKGVQKVWNENYIELTEDNVDFKQRDVEGSRGSLKIHIQDFEVFLQSLFSDIRNLILHHFIADSQKNCLSHCKDNLTSETAIVLMDFAENYLFVIQRSVQSFYCNNIHATIHPFIIYCKDSLNENIKIQQKSYVISDTKDHMAFAVQVFQEKLIESVKIDLPWIRNLFIFRIKHQHRTKTNT